MASKDYYSILGVSKTAKQNEIKTAFRKLAHQHHPDKGGQAEKFKEINEAYQVLGNEKKRKQYDQFGTAFNQGGAGFDFSGFQGDFSGANINFEDLGDIFGGIGDMFGFSSGSRAQGRPHKGGDIEAILSIDFMEAAFGAEKEIALSKNIQCEKCSGQGAEPGTKIETCLTCKGKGRVFTMQRTIFGAMQSESICSNCQGEGKNYAQKCSKCAGQGRYQGEEKMKIKIPAGINEGEAIRLSGRGEAGFKGSSAGDLLLRIRINPHKDFTRKGYDVFSKTSIGVKQAILGDKIKVKTVQGEVNLKIPEGTQAKTVFKIRNKGINKLRGLGQGDHFIEVDVKIPKNLNKNNRKILQDLDI